MPRGNAQNLRDAARRKSSAATGRAETALRALERDGAPITFRGLANDAGVSVDFLYRSPLRDRIEQLRAGQQTTVPKPRAPQCGEPHSQSAVLRALTAQLTQLRHQHRSELARLETALAAAHGENLELRRHIGRSPRARTEP